MTSPPPRAGASFGATETFSPPPTASSLAPPRVPRPPRRRRVLISRPGERLGGRRAVPSRRYLRAPNHPRRRRRDRVRGRGVRGFARRRSRRRRAVESARVRVPSREHHGVRRGAVRGGRTRTTRRGRRRARDGGPFAAFADAVAGRDGANAGAARGGRTQSDAPRAARVDAAATTTTTTISIETTTRSRSRTRTRTRRRRTTRRRTRTTRSPRRPSRRRRRAAAERLAARVSGAPCLKSTDIAPGRYLRPGVEDSAEWMPLDAAREDDPGEIRRAYCRAARVPVWVAEEMRGSSRVDALVKSMAYHGGVATGGSATRGDPNARRRLRRALEHVLERLKAARARER